MFKFVVLVALLSCVTGINVYTNHFASCLLNTETGNMSCTAEGSTTILQFHEVREVTTCPYHYCVVFDSDMDKMVCSGYIWNNFGGSHRMNPLTPDERKSNHHATSTVHLARQFKGYNLIADYVQYNVKSTFDEDISFVRCSGNYGTCVTLNNSTKQCFGIDEDVAFNEELVSLIYGGLVQVSLAIPMYIIAYTCFKKVFRHLVLRATVLPLIGFILSYIAMLYQRKFIVKVYPFLIGCIIGVFVTDNVVLGITELLARKLRKTPAVDTDDVEQSERLNEEEQQVDENGNPVTVVELT